MFTRRELFGGAIATFIPENFVDISDVRDVPDNQEVFVNVETDQSIIVEILQHVNTDSDEAAIRHHFMALAADNDAEEHSDIQKVELAAIPRLPPDVPKYLLLGQQLVSKFRETDPNSRNLLNILMALIRLPNHNTDIVITYNIPILIGATSSSRQTAREGNLFEGMEVFNRVLTEFEVLSWDLFNA
ncbi:7722_t:CDS:2 [Acaulospora colombiana]|uniref:7722_t:CDS:1 n=1 Tax=Acaulospora colombiana TaxID=27376 RepID=A0ACA9KE47_9GLOM|nr:7722_t:CDS:2 [Acaulospora colombiana]